IPGGFSNPPAYSKPVMVQPAVPSSPVEVAAQPEQAAVVTSPGAPAAIEAVAPAPGAPTKTADGAPIIYEKPVAPKAAADAGAISLDNMAQEATTGRAQVQTGAAKVGADASADDLNSISSDKAVAANRAALFSKGS
ncbi:hypothetical protein AD929_00660, partial [Gluconobacter potus]